MAKHVAGQLAEIVYAQFEPGEDLLEGIKAAVADVSGVRFELHEEERPADARPFENSRDDRGWPVEPLYHVLEEAE